MKTSKHRAWHELIKVIESLGDTHDQDQCQADMIKDVRWAYMVFPQNLRKYMEPK